MKVEQGSAQDVAQGRAEDLVLPDHTQAPESEEGRLAVFGFVDEVVDDDVLTDEVFEVDGGGAAPGHDVTDAQLFEGVDVGPVVDEGGVDGVAGLAVAGQEVVAYARVFQHVDGLASAEGRVDPIEPFGVLVLGQQFVGVTPPDDREGRPLLSFLQDPAFPQNGHGARLRGDSPGSHCSVVG